MVEPVKLMPGAPAEAGQYVLRYHDVHGINEAVLFFDLFMEDEAMPDGPGWYYYDREGCFWPQHEMDVFEHLKIAECEGER